MSEQTRAPRRATSERGDDFCEGQGGAAAANWFKSFSRNQTNPQEWLNTAVFWGFFLFKNQGRNRAIPILTHVCPIREFYRKSAGPFPGSAVAVCDPYSKKRITIRCYLGSGDICIEKQLFFIFQHQDGRRYKPEPHPAE